MQFKHQALPNGYFECLQKNLSIVCENKCISGTIAIDTFPAGSWVCLMSLGPKNSPHTWSMLNLLKSTQGEVMKRFNTLNCKQYLIKILVINLGASPHNTLGNTSSLAYFSEDKSQKSLPYENCALLYTITSNLPVFQ